MEYKKITLHVAAAIETEGNYFRKTCALENGSKIRYKIERISVHFYVEI